MLPSKIIIGYSMYMAPITNYPLAFNAYTLLLFSGAIKLDTIGRGLIVDGWLRLRGWARVGVLVSRLRGMVDDVIAQKIEYPSMDLTENEVVKAVIRLIEFDGMDA
jgi:ATP-dependent RNA helicase DHX57